MKPPVLKYRHWLKYNFLFFVEHIFGADFFNKPGNNKELLTQDIYNYLIDKQIDSENTTKTIIDRTIIHTPDSHLLYKGLAKSWPAYKKWTLNYFRELYGNREVLIYNTKGIVDPKAPQEAETILLKDYIDELEKGSLKYLKLSGLAQKEKSIQEDLDLNWLRSLKKKFSFGETFFMFIGGKETITPMHNEFPTTVYIQIHGSKKWIIYPPEDRIFLNAITERRPYFFSKYIPNAENKEHKIGQFARKHEILMEPGDVLIVPPFYWHYVENKSDSIGVAYKYANISSAFKSSKMLTILLFLSTRPFLFYSFFANRIKKEDPILSNK